LKAGLALPLLDPGRKGAFPRDDNNVAMPTPHRNIIIIDDDPTQGKIIEHVFKNEDYSFTLCKDAESALAIVGNRSKTATDTPFDLIICDFMLPGIDGFQAVEILRRNEHTKTTPILFISTHGYSVRNRAVGAGATAFMAKPINPPKIRAAVDALLNPAARIATHPGSHHAGTAHHK
jgi:CheY-like chemotaxis protein